ncbi:hypothetical protein DICVIV_07113 [Dictyocaulus viviparus]|uniref:Uncharacterized protein n=1 Tax=Dictyocaulus viviparus TaxID=29172 RepID=A0A0D8XQB7_DICVI|nr:hypothetical protein DICVIV_07113 [Dictyocaulus viviparus]
MESSVESSENVTQQINEMSLNEEEFRKLMEIHKNWYYFSLKAIMVQMAKELLHSVDYASGQQLRLCLKRIVYIKDLKNTAICLLKAKKHSENYRKQAETLRKESDEGIAFVQASPNIQNLTIIKQKLVGRKATSTLKDSFKNTIKNKTKRRMKWKFRRHRGKMRMKRSITRLVSSSEGAMNDDRLPKVTQLKSLPSLINPPSKSSVRKLHVPSNLRRIFNFVKSIKKGPVSRILSPRIAPLIPAKHYDKEFLSPSIFPLYTDRTEEQVLPIPEFMEHLNSSKLGEEILSATEKIAKNFDDLQKSLTNTQKNELNRRGYTFMEPDQLRKFHEEQGLNEPEINEMVKEYEVLLRDQREEALWKAIEKIAGKTKRQKRQISIAQPSILSPFSFTPFSGFSILGPVVLSPGIFSSFVLSPAILGPFVVSPFLGSPFILSPNILSPLVLSPFALGATVLSPGALAPAILSPNVLSATVLSPFALSPAILSPAALSATVLSPSLLSPAILSKSYLIASVLSPSFLS